MIRGTTNWETMLGCAFAWEIIAGANAQNAAPSQAGPREPTRTREKRKYQAVAVAIIPTVRNSRNEARGPKAKVTGVSGIETDNTDVFAIKLTPSGTFIWSEWNGYAKCVTTRAPCAIIHSNCA